MNIDSLGEQYYNTSSYVYALNAPTFFIDPDGREVDVTKLWDEIQNEKDEEDTDAARWALVQLVTGLSDISGLDIDISTNKKTGKTALVREGAGNGTKGEGYVKHLLESSNGDNSKVINVLGALTVKGSSSGGDNTNKRGDVWGNVDQIYGVQKSFEKKGVDKNLLSVGMAFIHEALHTRFGTVFFFFFFKSSENEKDKLWGGFTDNGSGIDTVGRGNMFRRDLNLPTRDSYGINSSFRVSKEGNKNVLIKFKIQAYFYNNS